jgi:hypothetical protein
LIIGVILGPRAELQMRRALQISDGELSGLVNTPFAIGVYAVIGLVLVWPLVHRLVVRRLRPAHPVPTGHAHPLVELAEELAVEPERDAQPRGQGRPPGSPT